MYHNYLDKYIQEDGSSVQFINGESDLLLSAYALIELFNF